MVNEMVCEKVQTGYKNKPDLTLKVECFNLLDTLECGQCFRWNRIDDTSSDRNTSEFIGVISDRVIRIKQENENIYVYSNNTDDLKETVSYYFDLYNTYDRIEKKISKIDENIKKAVEHSSGIHILNQEKIETLMSYIISSNNNIPRIKKSIEEISNRYGKKVEFEGKEYHLFPDLEKLSTISVEEFRECGVGFRDKYLYKTSHDLMENNIYQECTTKLSNAQLKKILMSFVGVGPKVADCTMLFSLGRQDVFPIDVWVKRVMEKLYLKKESSLLEIERYATENFGKYAGIIQEHLFYNIRNGVI